MTQQQALEVLAKDRGERVVITTMTAVGLWPHISDTPIDYAYLPSSMGQGSALGLGLALAQPDRGVIVVHGDGCTLMNLGNLVTIAQYPTSLYLIIMDNGIYEVTGGQPTAGSGQVNYAGLARAAGISRVYSFDTLEDWQANCRESLSGDGPVVVCLKVEARYGRKTPKPPRPMAEQIQRLQTALGVTT
ncbi:MAG: thiamine pyrophosphate-dependent enzyme [Gemmataceae bacterium]